MLSMLKQTAIDRTSVLASAAQTAITNGDILDLQNFDSILGIAVLGDIADTAVVTLKAFTGDNAALSDGAYEDVTASVTATATSADNKLLVLDIVKPGKRYVRFDLTRTTADAVIDGILGIRYNARLMPVTQGADVVGSGMNVN